MGLALQTRAAGFGSGRRRGGLQSPSGSLRVADPSGAAVAVRARGSKPVAPLRAKKSFGGTAPSSPLCFFTLHILWSDWRDSAFFCLPCRFFTPFVANSVRSNRINAIGACLYSSYLLTFMELTCDLAVGFYEVVWFHGFRVISGVLFSSY